VVVNRQALLEGHPDQGPPIWRHSVYSLQSVLSLPEKVALPLKLLLYFSSE
jgi:hypothetical protein